MNHLASNWRVKTSKKPFDSKLGIFDKFNQGNNSERRNPFQKNKNPRDRDTKGQFEKNDIFNKKQNKKYEPKVKEIKSFNKKIVIHQKENHNLKYSDKFANLKSSTIIKKNQKENQTEKQDSLQNSWYVEYEYEKEYANKLKNTFKDPDKERYLRYERERHKLNLKQYFRTLTDEDYQFQQKLKDTLLIQQYLLVDFEDVDLAYEYYKTTGLRLDQFIVEYSLDKIIMMDSKELFKLYRKLTKNLKSIESIEQRLKSKQKHKVNKQQLQKLTKKLEIQFRKKQIDFYKQYLENR